VLHALAQLPQTGAGGYSFPLLAAIAAGTGLLVAAATPKPGYQAKEFNPAQPLSYE
jgi:LPXTG-motif cell wall-anchored protein